MALITDILEGAEQSSVLRKVAKGWKIRKTNRPLARLIQSFRRWKEFSIQIEEHGIKINGIEALKNNLPLRRSSEQIDDLKIMCIKFGFVDEGLPEDAFTKFCQNLQIEFCENDKILFLQGERVIQKGQYLMQLDGTVEFYSLSSGGFAGDEPLQDELFSAKRKALTGSALRSKLGKKVSESKKGVLVEMCLVTGKPRSVSAIVDGSATIVSCSYGIFRSCIMANQRDKLLIELQSKVSYLQPLQMLQCWDVPEISQVAYDVTVEEFCNGQEIAKEGDEVTRVAIVVEGEVALKKNGEFEIASISMGGMIGDIEVFYGSKCYRYTSCVRGKKIAIVFWLTVEKFQSYFFASKKETYKFVKNSVSDRRKAYLSEEKRQSPQHASREQEKRSENISPRQQFSSTQHHSRSPPRAQLFLTMDSPLSPMAQKMSIVATPSCRNRGSSGFFGADSPITSSERNRSSSGFHSGVNSPKTESSKNQFNKSTKRCFSSDQIAEMNSKASVLDHRADKFHPKMGRSFSSDSIRRNEDIRHRLKAGPHNAVISARQHGSRRVLSAFDKPIDHMSHSSPRIDHSQSPTQISQRSTIIDVSRPMLLHSPIDTAGPSSITPRDENAPQAFPHSPKRHHGRTPQYSSQQLRGQCSPSVASSPNDNKVEGYNSCPNEETAQSSFPTPKHNISQANRSRAASHNHNPSNSHSSKKEKHQPPPKVRSRAISDNHRSSSKHHTSSRDKMASIGFPKERKTQASFAQFKSKSPTHSERPGPSSPKCNLQSSSSNRNRNATLEFTDRDRTSSSYFPKSDIHIQDRPRHKSSNPNISSRSRGSLEHPKRSKTGALQGSCSSLEVFERSNVGSPNQKSLQISNLKQSAPTVAQIDIRKSSKGTASKKRLGQSKVLPTASSQKEEKALKPTRPTLQMVLAPDR